MIKIGAQLRAAFEGKTSSGTNRRVDVFYLVRLGNNYYSTTWYSNLKFNNKSYAADGLLIGVQPPQTDSSLDKNRFKLTIADDRNILNSEIESLIGAPAHVYLGATSPNGQPINLSDGNLDPAELLCLYKGTIDGISIQYDTNEFGSQTITAELTNPFHNLDRKRTFYTTRKELRAIAPNDTSFDQIYTGSSHMMLRWGKYFGTK